jgi:hypothetical protein
MRVNGREAPLYKLQGSQSMGVFENEGMVGVQVPPADSAAD